jgi:hypothetical protein
MRKIDDFEWGPMDEVGFIKSENFIDRVYNEHFIQYYNQVMFYIQIRD